MQFPSLKELIDAGVHFGHQTQKWNPKMKPFVYMEKGGIHIIDLQKSMILCQKAIDFIKAKASNGQRMIFIGTKKQAVEPIKKAAEKCKQFYITKRWLGGTLTNFVTIKSSIDRLKKIDQMREKGNLDFISKKEKSKIEKEYNQLKDYLGGIRDMKESPSLMFVVDLVKERIAVQEAKKLGIPVIGIADTNSNPDDIDFPIPGNDDSTRSITLFCNMMAEAYLQGENEWQEKLKTEMESNIKTQSKEEHLYSKNQQNQSEPQQAKNQTQQAKNQHITQNENQHTKMSREVNKEVKKEK